MINPMPARGEGIQSQNIEESYSQYFDMVYRISFSYMKNAADTEDITADVFAKLIKNGIAFRDAEHEKAWLLRTAINTCKDALKHWWRKREDISDYESIQADGSIQIDETLKAVLALPTRYKDVIYLYYYDGYSAEEVAEILKKPYSTVRNHLMEARAYLKGVLEYEER